MSKFKRGDEVSHTGNSYFIAGVESPRPKDSTTEKIGFYYLLSPKPFLIKPALQTLRVHEDDIILTKPHLNLVTPTKVEPIKKMQYKIKIERWHPAKINDLLKAFRFKRSMMKRADKNMIWAYARHIPEATTRRSVSLTIIVAGRGRRPDPDAFTKSLNDALVNNGLLVDDSTKWVLNNPVEIISGRIDETIITLEDI